MEKTLQYSKGCYADEQERMMKIKISVLSVELKKDLWNQYISGPPELCPYFEVGNEFVIEECEMPKGFCTWAWHDLFYVFYSIWKGGTSRPWYRGDGISVVCCSDGLRPVTFKLERLEEQSPGQKA